MPGTKPCFDRCRIVRDVVNPAAPARSASSVRLGHLGVLVGRRFVVGPLADDVGPQRGVRHLRGDVERRAASASSASRYSANDSHVQSMPSCSAVPGMSSTPSISSMRNVSPPGRTGANPTPQLPITTVVTPCQLDGVTSGSHVTWPS